jgi:hypothetical protein
MSSRVFPGPIVASRDSVSNRLMAYFQWFIRTWEDRTGQIYTIYEQRIYSCVPGKLPALLSRFDLNQNEGVKRNGPGG